MTNGGDTMDPEALGAALRASGAELAQGLSDGELAGLESRFGFAFTPDHRLMLSIALPTGDRWPNWRGDHGELASSLGWPAEGIAFDVEHNAFWHPEWGERPPETEAALTYARERLASVPKLVPLYGHRYVPTVPHQPGNPVVSCYQTDIIYYGSDLLDWFTHEFDRSGPWVMGRVGTRLPFWSWFLE